MGITLMDNRNSLYSSYLKGWEQALQIFEEEMSRISNEKKKYKNN